MIFCASKDKGFIQTHTPEKKKSNVPPHIELYQIYTLHTLKISRHMFSRRNVCGAHLLPISILNSW